MDPRDKMYPDLNETTDWEQFLYEWEREQRQDEVRRLQREVIDEEEMQ